MLTSLYIHIPFCKHICTYCDFHKEVATLEKKKAYLNALIEEILEVKESIRNIKTIYIGGGTPSNYSIKDLTRLFQTLSSVIETNNDLEYTIEVNPDDITKEYAELFKKYGINRVSMGVQTINKENLSYLRRTHNEDDIKNAISYLKEAGISNISIDMIFNIPNQTMKQLDEDIAFVLNQDIKHISYYSLILEEKSILYQQVLQNKITIKDQDVEGDMYVKVIDALTNNGYNHYEISNFSTQGFESEHNKTYWTNKDYLGLGSGAHSLIGNKRFNNVSNVRRYIEGVTTKTPYKEEYDRFELEDEVMMGLRLLSGISIEDINMKYKIDLFKTYPLLNEYVKQDYLKIEHGKLKFTTKGLLVGNIVFMAVMEG